MMPSVRRDSADPGTPPDGRRSTVPKTLGRDGIAARIPHQGRMGLLERLDRWDASSIVCIATGHQAADHPLRTASGLLAPAAIEYAAQAMALHGALIGEAAAAGEPPAIRPGYLASVRDVRFSRLRLDDLPGELVVHAERQAGSAQQILYRFSVVHGGDTVAAGRAAVVLNAPIGVRP